MINTVHLLMLEQLRHRRQRMHRLIERFEHSRQQLVLLMRSQQERRAKRARNISGEELEAPASRSRL